MAKARGVIGAGRNLIRWLIWGFAGLFVVAVYLNWTKEPVDVPGEGELVLNVPAEETPAAEVDEQPSANEEQDEDQLEETMEGGDTEEVVSDAVEEQLEEATGTEVDAGDDGVAEDAQSVEEQADTVEDAGEETDAPVDGDNSDGAVAASEPESEAQLEDTMEGGDTEEVVSDAVEETLENATNTELDAGDDGAMEGAMFDLGDVRIPGDNGSYELLNAFRRDDGDIEITTRRTEGDAVSTTTRLVRCAPLEVGVIAEGEGVRTESPEMERIVLGSAAAWLAAQACGAMR